ncbi:MAG: PPC domain-containing protein [Planctomycetaceae bacterium]
MRPCLLLLSLLCCVSVTAAPPEVKSLHPMGARIGSTTEITVDGKLNQPGTSVWCSEASLTFEVPESGNTFQVTIPGDVVPGLYWVRFFNDQGATGLLPFVVGTLPEADEVEPNNEVAQVQKIEQSSVVNGKLGAAGDVDLYAVPMKKEQTLVAAVDSNWRLAAPVDMVMQILDPNGTVIHQNDDDHGFDPLLTVTAPTDGTWYVRVFGFPAKPNSTIGYAGGADYRYRLTLTTGPFANHAVPSVVADDSDLVQLVGWNLSDATEQPVSASRLAGDALGLAEVANTVPVLKRAGLIVVEKEPCDRSKPIGISADATICGVIDRPRDEDVFQFTAKKGERINFRVESRSLGYPLDPVVTVIDAAGRNVVESDDAARNIFDSLLKFKAAADGDYRVCIRDLFEHGGWRFAYRLHCEIPAPSVDLTVKADVFTVEQGELLEIPVTVTRNEKYVEEFPVSVEGLPAGVTVEAVVSQATGDSAKEVKLKLKADSKTGFHGPIRIVGSLTDNAKTVASAPLGTFKTSTEYLWLTVTAEKDSAEKKEGSKTGT